MSETKQEWDVFLSHASEDKHFANGVAELLTEAGVKVWYDSYMLKIGDSLMEKVSEGLVNSNYGIVILSHNFFKKKWPKQELASLFNLEIANKKVILPIWHGITFSELTNIAPFILDKVAGNSESDGLEKVIHNLLKVIRPGLLSNKDRRQIFSLDYKNSTELILLPLQPYDNQVIAIGKYPVTNKQYKEFLHRVRPAITKNVGDYLGVNTSAILKNPIGQIFKDEKWIGPFSPLGDERFNNDEQPIVCVSAAEAVSYAIWLNSLPEFKGSVAVLPTESLWRYAATGHFYPNHKPSSWFNQTKVIHHRADAPARVKNDGERINSFGVSDMFGNVWEWCHPVDDHMHALSIVHSPRFNTEIVGGGYLDDFSKKSYAPYLTSQALENELSTRHTDLGFRIAVILETSLLSVEAKQYVWTCEDSCHEFLEYWDRHIYSNFF